MEQKKGIVPEKHNTNRSLFFPFFKRFFVCLFFKGKKRGDISA